MKKQENVSNTEVIKKAEKIEKTEKAKTSWFSKILIVLTLLLVIGLGALGYFTFNLNTELNQNKEALKVKSNDLQTIQNALSQTEEGRKQLESLNQQLDKKATSAEKEADKANSQLDQANKDLKAQQAKLAQVNEQLAKAKRGIALFDSARSYYTEFVNWTGKCIGYIVAIQDAQYAGDEATANHYLGLLETGIDKVDYYDAKLNSVFSKLKSGKY